MSSYGMNTSTLLMRLLDHERALEREREQREAAAMQNMMRVTAAKQAEEKHTLEQKLKQAQLEGQLSEQLGRPAPKYEHPEVAKAAQLGGMAAEAQRQTAQRAHEQALERATASARYTRQRPVRDPIEEYRRKLGVQREMKIGPFEPPTAKAPTPISVDRKILSLMSQLGESMKVPALMQRREVVQAAQGLSVELGKLLMLPLSPEQKRQRVNELLQRYGQVDPARFGKFAGFETETPPQAPQPQGAGPEDARSRIQRLMGD